MNKRRSSVFTFGLITGITLMLYVMIGEISWHTSFIRLEVFKKVASSYVNNGTSFRYIIEGILWAFADGFLLGVTFSGIYRYFCSNIYRKD